MPALSLYNVVLKQDSQLNVLSIESLQEESVYIFPG